MRVLLVNHSAAENELGGAERSLLALGDAWLTAEPSVVLDVVTASAQGNFAENVRRRNWQLFAVDFWPWAIPNLYRPGENRYENNRRDEAAVLAIADHIRRTRPDVVVTNSIVNPWGAVAAGLTGTPHVWFAREYGDLDHGLKFLLGAEQSWQDVGLLSDLVIANSEAVRDHAAQYLPRHEIMVVYPPVDVVSLRERATADAGSLRQTVAATREGTEDPELNLVMVGTFGPAKRQHLAIEALAGLGERGIRASLTLVGPHDHPDYLESSLAEAERLGVADRIRLEGYQSDPVPYIESADVALMLSRSEAFGRVTLEYLALGTPVVGIRSGGTSELIADGHSGFVTSDDVDEIVDALERYAREPELLAAHAAAAADDAAAVAGRYPLPAAISAITRIAESAPRTPRLPHLLEYWLTLPEDVELLREAEREPSFDDSLRRFSESRMRPPAANEHVAVSVSTHDSSRARVAKPITIVVPVFGDLPSLEACIRSVLEYGDLDRNRLLLINDRGPESEIIESRVLELIDGVENVEYASNPRNLGFGATCNRAAYELDRTDNDLLLLNSDTILTPGAVAEMHAVLNLAEKHGAVCPRSNNATIASFPFNSRPRRGPHDVAHSLRKYAAVVDELPRYTVAPVALGFAFLVRRSLITEFGLFDEVFSPGYGEENDFCLRINSHGYSSVLANHAYVVHEGSRSFQESDHDAPGLKARNDAVLDARYPYFRQSVANYLDYDIDPLDWFADFLDPDDRHKRVMIDLYHLTPRYDGTSRNALSFLRMLSERVAREQSDVEFVIASSVAAVEFFGLDGFGFRTVWNHDVNELFDLGFSLVPVTDQDQLDRLNKYCARWLITHLDIIGARVLAIREVDRSRKQVLRDSLRFADRTVTISDFTRRDTLAFFPELPPEAAARMTVLHQGAARDSLEAKGDSAGFNRRQREVLEAGGYVLVVGNSFAHKQLPETVRALRGGPHTVIVFGSDEPDRSDNIVPVRGGLLSDAQVARLYAAASIVVYPSAYEGFGLPIAEAAKYGRSVVLYDTEVAHEVAGTLGLDESAHYFASFQDLPDVVNQALASSEVHAPQIDPRSLDDYNSELLGILLQELAKPVDLVKLRERVTHLRTMRAYLAQTREYLAAASYHIELTEARRAYKLVDKASIQAHRLVGLGTIIASVAKRRRRNRPNDPA